MTTFPKHQPILFETYLPNECSCNDVIFRVPARQSDVCQFQVVVSPCAGSQNVLSDPTFDIVELGPWQLAGGFTLISGDACCEEATGTATQFDVLTIGNIYQCTINVSSITGELIIYNGLTQVAVISTTGLTTFTFVAVAQEIQLAIESTEYSVCIASIDARNLSTDMSFGIINSSGATINVFSFADNPEYFTFTKDRVTIKFTWSDFDVDEGQCYTIGFADGCTNTNGQLGIFNNDFESCFSGWTKNVGTIPTIDCEELENPETGDVEKCIEFANTGTGDISSFVTTLKVGLSYSVTVDAMSDDADGFLRIYCGTNFHDFTVSGEQSDIVCAGNTTFKIEAHLQTASFVRVWSVTVALTNISDTEFDYESNVFKIGDNGCTHLLNLSNDDDGLGYVFEGANFAPQIRLESEIHAAPPQTMRETYEDNLGKKEVNFGEHREIFFLHIDYAPGWVIAFIAQCFIADHFFIDGVEYFIENEQLDPQYPENVCFSNMASLKLEISIKEQLSRNADIGNDENPITFGAQQVITDNQGHEITILQTGEAIDIPL